ncbi:hypothetical protein IAI12_33850, partial [Escherichia coli]|nr:hypothetical protein [Escherichia coli]
GDARHAPLLHQPLEKQQQVEVDLAQFHRFRMARFIAFGDEADSFHFIAG